MRKRRDMFMDGITDMEPCKIIAVKSHHGGHNAAFSTDIL